MYWLFVQIEKTEKYVLYSYSTGSHLCDGIMKCFYNGDVEMVKPCKQDEENKFAMDYAKRKAASLYDMDFPERRMIACG